MPVCVLSFVDLAYFGDAVGTVTGLLYLGTGMRTETGLTSAVLYFCTYSIKTLGKFQLWTDLTSEQGFQIRW